MNLLLEEGDFNWCGEREAKKKLCVVKLNL